MKSSAVSPADGKYSSIMQLCCVYNEQGEGRQKGGGDEWKGM